MSYFSTGQPSCTAEGGSVELVVTPAEKHLGGFSVRRVLPAPQRRMVGPFIFFDHMGPAEFPPGAGIQVRPHPHIGLATITYLFEGEIMHRDSLGFVQPIRAGAVNLMTAGRGIVHSERAGEDLDRVSRLHGIQSWMALPAGQEEIAPAFVHHAADTLPELIVDGVTVRVIIGSFGDRCSPVAVHSRTLYLECRMPAGTAISVPADWTQRAVYAVSGAVRIDGRSYANGVMVIVRPRQALRVESVGDTRLMVIGGEPLGERHIWWNFVSSSSERIERAKVDWRNGRFDAVPGETEFIPLPD